MDYFEIKSAFDSSLDTSHRRPDTMPHKPGPRGDFRSVLDQAISDADTVAYTQVCVQEPGVHTRAILLMRIGNRPASASSEHQTPRHGTPVRPLPRPL